MRVLGRIGVEFGSYVVGLIGMIVLIQVLAAVTWRLSSVGDLDFTVLADGPVFGTLREEHDYHWHQVQEWDGSPDAYKEPPILAQQVGRGVLPSVQERLPENPLVIAPVEQYGPYGGRWVTYAISRGDSVGTIRRITYEGLLRHGPMGNEIRPNLASHYEVGQNGKHFTFYLRRGVRWSDGQPFTADDIIFWYKHVILNPELTPSIHRDLRRNGEVVRVERVDIYTIRLHFAEPHGLFPAMVAERWGMAMVNYPKHYMKRFHPDFVEEDALQRRVSDAGFRFWHQLFEDRSQYDNPELPTLNAWAVENRSTSGPMRLRRNPYYWKVDPEGRQLPYVDEIAIYISNIESLNLRAMNGEAHFQSRNLTFGNLPLFLENADERNYRVLNWIQSQSAGGLMPNMNHRDPRLRQLFQERRFRIALSLAIDREEISELVYLGLGAPRQAAPLPHSSWYDAQAAEAYTAYDPERAGHLLDELGLDRRDDEGYRLHPDGQPLRFDIAKSPNMGDDKAVQLVTRHWREAGLRVDVNFMSRELFSLQGRARSHDVAVAGGGVFTYAPLDRQYLVPGNYGALYAMEHMQWFNSRGKMGKRPPPAMRETMEKVLELERTVELDRQREIVRDILRHNAEQCWAIGLLSELPATVIVHQTLRNVPERAVAVWQSPGRSAPESFAIDPSYARVSGKAAAP